MNYQLIDKETLQPKPPYWIVELDTNCVMNNPHYLEQFEEFVTTLVRMGYVVQDNAGVFRNGFQVIIFPGSSGNPGEID